jgi:CBS domain-containing protein
VVEMMRICDVMTRSVISARAETPLKEVARLLVHNGISGLPVVNDDGDVVAQVDKLEAVTAGECMTTPAVTIASDRLISEAAATMTARRVNRLPVVDHGRVVGIVTRADLIRAYVRSDEELATTIRQEVLLRTLWEDPTSFTVEVVNGVASIKGHVERRSIAGMVDRAIRLVPGIVDVLADVTWGRDDSQIGPGARDPVFPFSQ